MTDQERIAELEARVLALTECMQVLIAAVRAQHEIDSMSAQLALADYCAELLAAPVTDWQALRSMLTNAFFSGSLPEEVRRLLR